jgi:hypothetical protein
VSNSPEEIDILDLRNYTPQPDKNTIIHHPPYNLPAMGIVINLHFRCVICLKCERAINSFNLIDHLHKDLPMVEIPEDLPSDLETAYGLVPYSSVVYKPGPISPVFGIPLQYEPIIFCDCGKGYSTMEGLRPHQTRVGERECPFKERKPGYHKGYGQRLTSNRPFFEVFPTAWQQASDSLSQYPLVFS